MRSTRIIPACAGSTASAVTQRKWSLGSSPHARGAHAIWRSLCLCQGIIPACAGSTRPVSRSGRGSGDHPRMRGEHCDYAVTHSINWGSSPHARGAPERGRRESRCFGIIPACAGSTSAGPCRSCRPQDHPRMRGEHRMIPGTSLGEMGSSPHARGARRAPLDLVRREGIIPACAGSTSGKDLQKFLDRDHPRMRGEHPPEDQPCRARRGSSPHARGALHRLVCSVDVVGIIPACAGSTLEYLQLCPGLKRITLTLPITSEADKRTEKHPNHQLMPRAFRPSRRHCRAGCGPIHCLTPRTSWPSCTCLPCSSPFSSCRQASRHPCPSAS